MATQEELRNRSEANKAWRDYASKPFSDSAAVNIHDAIKAGYEWLKGAAKDVYRGVSEDVAPLFTGVQNSNGAVPVVPRSKVDTLAAPPAPPTISQVPTNPNAPPATAVPQGYGKAAVPFGPSPIDVQPGSAQETKPPPGTAAAAGDSSAPIGQWETKGNTKTYMQGGQEKGRVELFPGTGGYGGYGHTPSKPRPDYEPSDLTRLGNWNIDQGKTGGGTYSEMAGPGQGSMSAAEWNALSNEDRIAKNVAAYEGAAKAEHDRWGQRVAAMDGRDYDYSTGKVAGPSDQVLAVGKRGWDIPEFDSTGPNSGPLRFEHGGWTDAPKEHKGGGGGGEKGPSLSDFLDLAKMNQDQQQFNQRFGLDQAKAAAEAQRGQQGLGLDATRTMSQVGKTNQEMEIARREQLASAFQNSGLSAPMVGVGQSIAAQYPQIPQDVLMAALADVSGAQTGDPGSGWNPFAGKKKWGELEKFDNPTAPAAEVLKRAQEIMKQRGAGK